MSVEPSDANLPSDGQRTPPKWLFKALNAIVRPILMSRFHSILSSKLMVLRYTGSKSGREYSFPIGYFAWEDNQVLSISSANWPSRMRDGKSVKLLIKGTWHDAIGTPTESVEGKVALLEAFEARFGVKALSGLNLGLSGDHKPTNDELRTAAEKTTMVLFALSTNQKPAPLS